jgi:hypothetical protein
MPKNALHGESLIAFPLILLPALKENFMETQLLPVRNKRNEWIRTHPFGTV